VTVGLDDRLQALADAVEVASGRLSEETVAPARRVVAKAGARLGLGLESTVVALAGPTGAGKSSLFNALAGADVSRVGRLRPTTAAASAATWGDANPALLDWLDVPRRHRAEDGEGLEGLVLLDLPDFDSVETTHRSEVDRLVELVDLVVWVVDPQKYADAAWHDRYLRPLAAHDEAMAVALNQVDLLTPSGVDEAGADLERLLVADGLQGVPVLAVSVRTGDGLEDVRRLLAERVAAREAATARLAADVGAIAGRLAEAAGDPSDRRVGGAARERLADALADAAGADVVARAVEEAHRRRGSLATGWPFVRWVRRLRPDPLRRLRLQDRPQEHVATSLPGPSAAGLARVENAARGLAAEAAEGLPAPWPRHARDAALESGPALPDALDRAVAGTDLGVRAPRWWRVAGWVQSLLALVVAAGVAWLLALVGLAFLRVDDVVPVPELRGVPVPTALLLGAALAGIVLAIATRLANGAAARRRGRAAHRAVRRRVEAVGQDLVLAPVDRELEAHARFARAVAAAAARPRHRRQKRGAVSAGRA
jgi:GTP-binding protein EngB required for normal cell division